MAFMLLFYARHIRFWEKNISARWWGTTLFIVVWLSRHISLATYTYSPLQYKIWCELHCVSIARVLLSMSSQFGKPVPMDTSWLNWIFNHSYVSCSAPRIKAASRASLQRSWQRRAVSCYWWRGVRSDTSQVSHWSDPEVWGFTPTPPAPIGQSSSHGNAQNYQYSSSV